VRQARDEGEFAMNHSINKLSRICSRAAFSLVLVAAYACGGVDVEDLRKHASQWTQENIDSYTFIWFEGCFCDVQDVGGYRVRVRNGVAQEAIGVQTGIPFRTRELTIDNIYARAIAIAETDPDEFKITYDAKHRFPTSIHVDQDSGAEDDELSLEVRCFSRDVDDAVCPVNTLSLAECEEKTGTATLVDPDAPETACESISSQAIGRIEGDVRVCCSNGS
jgi:Family of unknown function (DUF6174)